MDDTIFESSYSLGTLHSVAIYTRAPMINSIVIDFNNEDAFLMQDIVD